ncbi:hypothetical protein [Hylemonella gracilis]|uniref:hypothetical protein n=1 Tax=Hylemonella gracilis TaxID=80880 RepID=UPI0012DD0CAF|nr:hypothetical protein [Hylemonella gracilis]
MGFATPAMDHPEKHKFGKRARKPHKVYYGFVEMCKAIIASVFIRFPGFFRRPCQTSLDDFLGVSSPGALLRSGNFERKSP